MNNSLDISVVKRWNWDYREVESFQLECLEKVRENPKEIILIICSHPRCYTLGRGLQKIKGETDFQLQDFDPAEEKSLKFPLYKIKRGGGLTFHYPGQLIIYPIVNLTHFKIGVHDLMTMILEVIKKNLEDLFSIKDLVINKQLLGLWSKEAKLASIGLAVSHFVTYHGLALNVLNDPETFKALQTLYPCGLPGNLYKNIENMATQDFPVTALEQLANSFQKDFTERFVQV